MKLKTFNPIWEEIFKSRNWGKYPPEELIRFIAINFYKVSDRREIRILDLGCGTGACTWFIAREGFSTYGIDGSKTAIEINRNRLDLENLKAELIVNDIAHMPWQNDYFDAVIDVDCLQCNNCKDSQIIIDEIYRVLKPKGKHFSITAKRGCWGDKTGTIIDNYTYKNVTEGPFSDMGTIRFSTKSNIKKMYQKFYNLSFECSIRTMNDCQKKIAHWIFSCQK
ncbi:SAM-dependent methyltransferase [Candidatus Beckwithbacteria bacterium CG23_combo_of_CG06-09_8_20_14_all_34_8]|uniref:SAM-dependent methyltransferase n=1 Tax=Candidatus Beckwithbacteria bacterium CG23_combo_of_CG06-09_8_20_14_all_34_8 TaxID=1974497 RepID=A0A2H0B632_9BACT|nr:MAG: SAM-dependent methyltransferase [Candidatus Beckwithbacteria bacterium CG23_combo_of_CG06-09_8_20_14_all_34_8]